MSKKAIIVVTSYISLLAAIVGGLYLLRPKSTARPEILYAAPLTPTPTPYIFTTYDPPTIEKKEVYKIAMIGDSMTAALGPHGGEMSEFMNSLYKKEDGSQGVIIDNYAISSNILAVDNQIARTSSISEYTFGPLLSEEYDLLLIESFGYNPLSEFGVQQGIVKQNEALDRLMTTLITQKPDILVVFVATIAPDFETYGQSTQPDSSPEDRKRQAEERVAYIKNHIEYANKHSIPVINIYEKTLTEEGDGDEKYVNQNDDIHPSFLGVKFIGEEIGRYIYDNKLLPV